MAVKGFTSQNGLLENLSAVIDDFRKSRGLNPLKILVHGPPVSGKSTLARALAEEYEVPHISMAGIAQGAV